METATQTPSSISQLLRPDDVARMLNISKSLAYRLLEQGQIPTVRFNRTVRVRQADLDAFVERSYSTGVGSD